MKMLRIVLPMLLTVLLALTGCSAKDGEATNGTLSSTLPVVTVPDVTVPSATVSPTVPDDNGILSTESPAASATATAVPNA